MRMSSGISGDRSSSYFGDRTFKLKDKTKEIMDISFPPPADGVVKWRHSTITGMPESGKSVVFDDRGWHAVDFYRRYQERVQLIRTDSLNVAYDLIQTDPAIIKYVQIDDAATHAASIAPYELKDMIATFQKLRHVLEDSVGTDTGVMIVDFGWQRWKEVYPTFRNGVTQIFKTGMAEPDDDNHILRTIGVPAHKELHRIWNLIVRGDQDIKSTSIGYIPSQRGQKNAAGYYHSTYRKDWADRPKMIFATDHFTDAVAVEALLDKIRNRDDSWAFKVQCYELTEMNGMTTYDAAAELGSSQGWVSKCAKAVKAELAK